MTTATAKLTDQVLSLPCEDRLYLVDKLIEGLNAPTHETIDKLWAEEAEQRIDELDTGKADEFPGEEVFAEIRKRLRK